jgi:hypothetical protein
MRVAGGLLVVAIGSAWFAGGGSGLRTSGDAIVQMGPYILVIGGILLILRTFAARWALTGPLLVISAGAIWLMARHGYLDAGTFDRNRALPAAIVIAGALIALTPRKENQIDTGNTRILAVLISRECVLQGMAPRRLSVSAILGSIRVDLASAEKSSGMEIDLNILCGRIIIVLPPDSKPLVAGRLALARGIRFEGYIDEPLDNVSRVNGRFVINVLGLGGVVQIERSQVSAKPQASAPSIDGDNDPQEMSS